MISKDATEAGDSLQSVQLSIVSDCAANIEKYRCEY